MKKTSLNRLVKSADDAKKVNPLDLSSDQDLTIALMNLLVIEDAFEYVRDIRIELMSRIVAPDTDAWGMSERLLGMAMQLIDDGNKAAGDSAYKLYARAYELYSMFWGVNMGLIDVDDVKI
ncbi:MAG: hypothetical protein R8M37_02320 [Alphaproteobacteria bacterium]|nr:hypothetical protein [Alphaproteobacteria bacterium]